MAKEQAQQKLPKAKARDFAASKLSLEKAIRKMVNNTKIIENKCFFKESTIKLIPNILLIILILYEEITQNRLVF